jgi:FKBP-type peptidyl-prolyl cis-trans isomerase
MYPMKKLTKQEWIGVTVAIVATTFIFFGGSLWNFFFGAGDLVENIQHPAEKQIQLTNISTVEGLEIYDIQVGTGEEAVKGKDVSAHYIGILTDGTQFDSSEKRGPHEFKLGAGSVIEGWDLGLVGMKEGGIRRLVISPEYGYGNQPIGPIPPNSTLIFEVQLVDVK